MSFLKFEVFFLLVRELIISVVQERPARVFAKRLSGWAERLVLLDANQAGFRSDRSTADVEQMGVGVQEDAEDCMGGEDKVSECPLVNLLDLRKGY